MKSFLIPTIAFIFLTVSGHAQAPLVKQWDRSYGGYNSEFLSQVFPTPDGGFVCGGVSMSNMMYEKSADNWDNTESTYDWWLIKSDANGVKQWDITLGGTDNDFYYNAIATSDGGYLVTGSTNSPVSGNLTQPSHGMADMWVVKLDGNGLIQWQKRFGGDSVEAGSSAMELASGGYLIGGHTNSSQGQDVSDPPFGSFDLWLVRLDANGNKIWDKRYGGSSDESLSNILPAPGNQFMLMGATTSPVSGVKTQPNYVNGIADIWFVRTDSSGNKLSDDIIGSLESDYAAHAIYTMDGNYLMACMNFAGIGGDKTETGYGVDDFWLIKLDTSLNHIWDHSIGGWDNEGDGTFLSELQDGSYLLSGTSYSPPGFWKSEANIGPEATWTIKLDAQGNKVWDKTIFTPFSHDEYGAAVQLIDGCIIIANDGGGMTGMEKADTSWNFDYWCIKYCDTTNAVSLPVAAFAAPTQLCPGTCADFTNLSTNAQTFTWSFPGASPDTSTALNPTSICYLNPGSYDVVLVASNATGSDTLQMNGYVTVFAQPPPQGIQQSGDTLLANQGAVGYQWYYNGNLITGATNYFYVATASGDYNVVATDDNGCEVEAVIFNVIAGGIDINTNENRIHIYPNPASSKLDVSSSTFAITSICIFDLPGEKVLTLHTFPIESPYQQTVDISRLSPGVYFLKVETGPGSWIQKVVVQ